MKVYDAVESYMKTVGLKYVKNTNDLIGGLALRGGRDYAKKMAEELNSRASGGAINNTEFYRLKNTSYDGSIYVSAAFDGGVFRHIGNMIIDTPDLFSGRVLDLCCDCGITSCFMALTYPDCSFTAVDKNELAVKNAETLAQKLNLKNIEFETADIFTLETHGDYDTVTSFRALLDATYLKAKSLPFIGYRPEREKKYEAVFAPYAGIVSKALKDGGNFFSVERYTPEYGWLGFLRALQSENLGALSTCRTMVAQDLAGPKDYSVTFCKKGTKSDPLAVFNSVMSSGFKSGTGYDGALAEFALYYDSEGKIEFTQAFHGDKIIHEWAFAKSKSGKMIYYDASNSKRKVKYFNEKKLPAFTKNFEASKALFDPEKYTLKTFTKTVSEIEDDEK